LLFTLPCSRSNIFQWSETPTTLTKESEAVVPDAELCGEIFKALDAAERVHTDPFISHFPLRGTQQARGQPGPAKPEITT
jgi:hypothetical protein